MNDYYICVRRFVVIDPELPDSLYHVLVLKKNVHKPGHFQYTIHYEGKSLFVHRHKKDLPYITCIFHLLK